MIQLNGVDAALWAKHVPSQLTSRALQVFARFSIDDSMNYQKVKETILASYNLGPQAYLRNFRTMKRTGSMNYVNHLTNMKEIFCRFVEESRITDFDSIFDQMLGPSRRVGAKLQATNRVPRPVDRGTATRYGG